MMVTKSKLRARPPEEVKPGHSKLMIYGGPSSGKTTFALSFPRPFFIDTEAGASLAHYMARLKEQGGGYMGPSDGSTHFPTIFEQVSALATERHEYQTLVIDSLTEIYQEKITEEAVKLGDDDHFGASKKPAVLLVKRLWPLLKKLRMNVVLTAHEIPKWEKVGNKREQTGYEPDIYFKTNYQLDLTLRAEKHGKGYRTATVDKTRLTGFPEFDRFDLQKNGADVGFENFAARYGIDYITAAPEPISLASAEQVAKIEHLLTIVRIDDETIAKWLKKAEAETWADLSVEQAEGVLKHLTAKVDEVKA